MLPRCRFCKNSRNLRLLMLITFLVLWVYVMALYIHLMLVFLRGTHQPESMFKVHCPKRSIELCLGLGDLVMRVIPTSIKLCRVPSDGSARTVVWVYSLKSGLWKCIGDFPQAFLGSQQQGSCYLDLIRQRVFVSGALHWRLHPHYGRVCANLIAALDLGNSEFYLVPYPDFWYEDMCLHLGVLDGCLSAISYNYGVHGFDLCVMKEYGVKESWTRLVRCTGYTRRLTPLAYTENGNRLLFFVTDSNVTVLYEFETRAFKRMIHCWSPELGKPLVYVPSLVCPESGVLSGHS